MGASIQLVVQVPSNPLWRKVIARRFLKFFSLTFVLSSGAVWDFVQGTESRMLISLMLG